MPEFYKDVPLEEADQYHAQAIDLLRESDQYFLCVHHGERVTTIGGDRTSDSDEGVAKRFASAVYQNALQFLRAHYE